MRDAKALFFIQQASAESIFPLISKATKSKEAWDAIQARYQNTVEVITILIYHNVLKFYICTCTIYIYIYIYIYIRVLDT